MEEKDYNEVKKILNMREWEDPKFHPLLTSTIWNKNSNEIKNILSMEEWKNSDPLSASNSALSRCQWFRTLVSCNTHLGKRIYCS